MREPNVVVVVFTMSGCPACSDYMPTFQRVQRRHPRIPVQVRDAIGDGALAQRFGVTQTPTTLVLRRGPGSVKLVGALDASGVEYVFALAERYA